MRNYFYLNVNGFYGLSKKDEVALKKGIDDDACKENAVSICKMIFENGPKFDAIFFAEFASCSIAGKTAIKIMEENGYTLVLPNDTENISPNFYSVVVAFVRKDLGIKRSNISPNGWYTWCEIEVDGNKIIAIHSTRREFLEDIKSTLVKENSEYKNNTAFFGDTNVTDTSNKEDNEFFQEIIKYAGKEFIDKEEKATYRGIRKPDRVFGSIECTKNAVLDGFYRNELSDHDALCVSIFD